MVKHSPKKQKWKVLYRYPRKNIEASVQKISLKDVGIGVPKNNETRLNNLSDA